MSTPKADTVGQNGKWYGLRDDGRRELED